MSGLIARGFTYRQTGVGAVARKALAKMRETFTLSDYYDPAEGAAAMHNALTRLVTEAPRQTVQIDLGNYDWSLASDFTLPASKRVLIHGSGSVAFNGGSFLRAHHGQFTALRGLKVTGANPALKFDLAPATSAFYEYEVQAIEAAMNAGVWALHFNGAREGVVDKCYFRSGRGIYRTLSNICHVSKSFFLGVGWAVHDDGQGSGFSAGFHLADSEILGCNRSVVVDRCDDGQIENCTIDYNDEGIYLTGQDRFKIFGGYIGTRTAEAATPNIAAGAIGPALSILPSGATRSEKVQIIGAVFTGHDDGNLGYSNIYLENADKVTIADSTLSFYTQNAVRYGSNVTFLNVHDNATAPKPAAGAVNVFECVGADSNSNRFTANQITSGQGIACASAVVARNMGYTTKNSGEVVLPSGTSSIAVNHGLSFTPQKFEVTLTPTNAEAAGKNPYVLAVSSTQITIALTANAAASAGVGWVAEKKTI